MAPVLCDPPKRGGEPYLNLRQLCLEHSSICRVFRSTAGGVSAKMNLLKSIAIVLLLHATPALAQPPMLEEADAAELIGGAVQSAEGIEVGEVSAVAMNKDGEV
jgi:hypothetical protein